MENSSVSSFWAVLAVGGEVHAMSVTALQMQVSEQMADDACCEAPPKSDAKLHP